VSRDAGHSGLFENLRPGLKLPNCLKLFPKGILIQRRQRHEVLLRTGLKSGTPNVANDPLSPPDLHKLPRFGDLGYAR
jgi:hypothetical protein